MTWRWTCWRSVTLALLETACWLLDSFDAEVDLAGVRIRYHSSVTGYDGMGFAVWGPFQMAQGVGEMVGRP